MKIVPPSSFLPLGSRLAPVASEPGPGSSTLPFSLLGGLAPTAMMPGSEAHASSTEAPGHGTATLVVKRDGDRITHIEVRCGCGTVHRIECTY